MSTLFFLLTMVWGGSFYPLSPSDPNLLLAAYRGRIDNAEAREGNAACD
jgi:hypothetical protein